MFEKNKLVVKIEGMYCEHCAAKVKKALEEKEGLKVKVDLKNKEAVIKSNKEIDKEMIKNIVIELGYEVVDMK